LQVVVAVVPIQAAPELVLVEVQVDIELRQVLL
jgi:hypothetical protein